MLGMIAKAAVAALLALAVPTLALAQEHEHEFHGHQQFGSPMHPGPGPGGPPSGAYFVYHGHNFNRAHLSPFIYPPGWAYRRWAVGALLPPLFLAPAYYYGGWAGLGLPAPLPGYQWVRYGPDLLLVNVATGQVAEVANGVFY